MFIVPSEINDAGKYRFLAYISRKVKSKDLSANLSTSKVSTNGKRSLTKLESFLFLSLLFMISLSTMAKLLPSSSKSAFPVMGMAFFGNLGSKSYISIASVKKSKRGEKMKGCPISKVFVPKFKVSQKTWDNIILFYWQPFLQF